MNEADVLAATYDDLCIVERLDDVEDSKTGITTQKYQAVYESKINCALSQARLDGLAVVEAGDMLNNSVDNYTLFIRPEVEILRGDRITVFQKASGLTIVLFATKPFYYPSHCEVGLTGRDPIG